LEINSNFETEYVVNNVYNLSKHIINEKLTSSILNEVGIEYIRIDELVSDEYGNVLAEMFFIKPVLKKNCLPFIKINNFFNEEVKGFFYGSDNSIYFKESNREYFFDSVDNMRDKFTDNVLIQVPLHHKVETELTYVNTSILSFKLIADWMAGGVRNTYYYGVNFNMMTGELLTLRDLISVNIECFNKQILTNLNIELKDYFEENQEKKEVIIQKINNSEFEDYMFFIEGENIFIIFNYEVFNSGGYVLEMSNVDFINPEPTKNMNS
jgi:hypothetical protein